MQVRPFIAVVAVAVLSLVSCGDGTADSVAPPELSTPVAAAAPLITTVAIMVVL